MILLIKIGHIFEIHGAVYEVEAGVYRHSFEINAIERIFSARA